MIVYYKKNNMYKKTLLFLLILPFFVTAQNIELPTDYVRNTLSGKNNLPNNVTGSPYIDEEFKEGTITIGDKQFDTQVRHNGLNDTFEIKNKDGEITSLNRLPDLQVETNSGKFAVFTYNDENGNKNQRFFKILADNGNIKFLKLEGIEYKEGREAQNSYSRDVPPSLDPYEEYYLKEGNRPAEVVRLRKKHVLRYIDDKKASDYAKANDLKLKDPEEVIQLVNGYN